MISAAIVLYVNPATTAHLGEVDKVISPLANWASPAAAEQYPSAELIFNEYMTWATFLEYARDHLDAQQFAALQQRIVAFMEERRGFTRFRFVCDTIKALRESGPRPIADLYPQVLERAAALRD